jgi:hypothetical protein
LFELFHQIFHFTKFFGSTNPDDMIISINDNLVEKNPEI